MSRQYEFKTLTNPEERARLLQDVEQSRQALTAEMYALLANINAQLEQLDLYTNKGGGPSRARKAGGHLTVSARIQGSGGVAIRFGCYDLNTRKFTTRARIHEVDKAGASWLVGLPEHHRKKILELDRTRRLLNLRYRILNAEQKALFQFDRDERDLDAALQSQAE